MDTKLTLKLEQQVIENAKIYAKMNHISLSKLIENYLHKITEQTNEHTKITPLVKSLSGIIELPETFNEKDAYANYLTNKYK